MSEFCELFYDLMLVFFELWIVFFVLKALVLA